jgi:hypothetical protein
MPDEIHIAPNDDGDFVISRDGGGEVTITPQHLINLAKILPGMARQVLQNLHAQGSRRVEAISGLNVETISIRCDLLAETVLLQVKDKQRMEYAFVLPAVHAKILAENLLSAVSDVEKDRQRSKQ